MMILLLAAVILCEILRLGTGILSGNDQVDLFLQKLLDRGEQRTVFRRHQAHGVAGNAGTARAADTVHVILGHIRKVVVHDVGKLFDIKAASRDIRRDEHLNLLILKVSESLGAGVLALVAVNGGSGQAILDQLLAEAVRGVLHTGEDQHLGPLFIDNQITEQFTLPVLRHGIGLLFDQGRFLIGGNFDRDRGIEKGVREFADFRAEGGREEQALAGFRNQLDQFPDVMNEAHVEHAVGFIEHQELHRGERHMLLTEMIQKAARRGDKNIDAAGKGRGLGLQVHAAENEGGTDVQILRVRRNVLVDLSREFAGRSQNQRCHFLRLRADAGLSDLLNDRQAVSRGLAGAGLSGGQHVLAFKQGRNGFLLNRGRFAII